MPAGTRLFLLAQAHICTPVETKALICTEYMRAHPNRENRMAGNASRVEEAAAAVPPRAAPGEGSGPTISTTSSTSEATPAKEIASLSPLLSLKDEYFQDSNRDRDASSSSGMESDDYEYDYTTDSDGLGSHCADSARGKVPDTLACVSCTVLYSSRFDTQ